MTRDGEKREDKERTRRERAHSQIKRIKEIWPFIYSVRALCLYRALSHVAFLVLCTLFFAAASACPYRPPSGGVRGTCSVFRIPPRCSVPGTADTLRLVLVLLRSSSATPANARANTRAPAVPHLHTLTHTPLPWRRIAPPKIIISRSHYLLQDPGGFFFP